MFKLLSVSAGLVGARNLRLCYASTAMNLSTVHIYRSQCTDLISPKTPLILNYALNATNTLYIHLSILVQEFCSQPKSTHFCACAKTFSFKSCFFVVFLYYYYLLLLLLPYWRKMHKRYYGTSL